MMLRRALLIALRSILASPFRVHAHCWHWDGTQREQHGPDRVRVYMSRFCCECLDLAPEADHWGPWHEFEVDSQGNETLVDSRGKHQ